MSQAEVHAVLLAHRGELDDIRCLLEELPVEFVDHTAPEASPHAEDRWSLVIATARRILEERIGRCKGRVRMAVIDEQDQPCLDSMRQAGVELVVRRPVHPAALRLLILHSLYRGPEKRHVERVGVGAPIRFRQGLRRLDGILVDLSLGGCRILTSRSMPLGKRLTIPIPDPDGASPPLGVRGSVVRCGIAEGDGDESMAISLRFDPLDWGARERLGQLLLRYARGPASLGESFDAEPDRETSPGAEEESLEALLPEDSDAGGPERRRDPRRTFTKRVIALGESATRVLLGRDISSGGMRVDASGNLAVGDRLRLALHVHAHRAPLVVWAKVVRDDGDRGFVLRYVDLEDDQRKALAETIDHLPTLDLSVDDDQGLELLVSEILDRQVE